MTKKTQTRPHATKKAATAVSSPPTAMPDYDAEPTVKGGEVKDLATIERLFEKAADDFRSLNFGGALERLVWDIMSPGCSQTEKNTLALIALICALEKAALIASVNDWGLLCGCLKGYIYNWSDQGVEAMLAFTRKFEKALESEVKP